MELRTPLLDHPLQGSVYLGTPECSPCSDADAQAGRLLKLYIEVDDPTSGVVIKLPGSVSADPATGQLTASFKENPELPFEELALDFKSGPRAALATPATCGHYTTSSDLRPWSAPQTADAISSSSFEVKLRPGRLALREHRSRSAQHAELRCRHPQPSRAGALQPLLGAVEARRRLPANSPVDTIPPPGPDRQAGRRPLLLGCPARRREAAGGNAEKASPSCPAATDVGTVVVGAGAGS